MKKGLILIISMLVVLFALSQVYAAELLTINLITDSGCNVKIDISSDATSEILIGKINEIYSKSNIINVLYNSKELESLKTMSEQGIVSGSKINLVSNTEHSYIDKGITLAPTCTKTGVHTYKCEICGLEKTKSVDKLEHALNEVRNIKPTCEANGLIRKECIRCDYHEEIVLPKLGHAYGKWEVSVEPTCTKEGKMQRVCTRCGKKQETSVAKIEHDIIVEAKKPTCENVGYKIEKCSYDCGYIKSKTPILATGHDMSNWQVTKAATLVEKGEKVRVCQNDGCNYCETEEIESLTVGGSKTNVVDNVVEAIKKEENKEELFILIGIIMLPVVFVFLRDIIIAETNKRKDEFKSKKETKTKKKK